MILPCSDELNIGFLSRLFANTSNCYKFFWFQAILRKVNTNQCRLHPTAKQINMWLDQSTNQLKH